MQFRHAPPKSQDEFEELCLQLLRRHWNCETLERYGHRGEEQSGVDIIDLGGGTPLRAAQCKAYASQKTLPPTEIVAEIEKARQFQPPLGRYVILTTAKISRNAQQKVLSINQEHTATRLFTVELLAWEQIEAILDEHPDLSPQFNNVAPTLRALHAVMPPSDIPVAPARDLLDAFDSEISHATSLFTQRRTQDCRLLLSQIRSRSWDRLNARQKYRVLANLGLCFYAEHKLEEAARLFLEAKTHQPEDDSALANEALGYWILGERERGAKLAEEAYQRFPYSDWTAVALIATAPPDQPARALAAKLSPAVLNFSRILVGLAERAIGEQDTEFAAENARKASEMEKPGPYPWLLLAQAEMLSQALARESLLDEFQPEQSVLTNAIAHATAAHELAASLDLPDAAMAACLTRADAKDLIGDSTGQRQDVELANQVAPRNPAVLRERARLLLADGEVEGACNLLRQAIAQGGGPECRLLLGMSLPWRNNAQIASEAADLLSSVALEKTRLKDAVRFTAAIEMVRALAASGRAAESAQIVDKLPSEHFDPYRMAVVRTAVAISSEELEEVQHQADLALQLAPACTERAELFQFASILEELGRYPDALPIWERIASRRSLTDSTRHLLNCAARLQREDVLMQWCRDLRAAGIHDRNLIQSEVRLLQEYDRDEAVVALTEHLAADPEFRLGRLLLSALGLRLNRPNLVVSDPAQLPDQDEIDHQNWPILTQAVMRSQDPWVGLRFAYQLFRKHFGTLEAHRCFAQAMLDRRVRGLILAPTTAGLGTAVQYRLEHSGELKWVILEDEAAPSAELGEIALDSELAIRLLGKKIGEPFRLGQYQQAAVVSLQSKYVYSYQQSLGDWESRFPSDTSVVTMPAVDHSGKPDLTHLLAALDRRAELVEEIENFYRSNPIPIAAVARAMGKHSAFEAQVYLAQREGMSVRCCNGDQQSRTRALQAYASAGSLVADVSTLATLWLVSPNLLDQIRSKEIIVADSAIEEIEALCAEEPRGVASAHVGRSGKDYYWAEETREHQEARRSALRDFTSVVRARCSVTPSTPLAGLPPEKRERMKLLFGFPSAAAIAVAASRAAVLWTDDYPVAAVAASEHGVRTIWTQGLLHCELAAARIDPELCFNAELDLLVHGYTFTSVHPALIAHAGRQSRWNPGEPRLAAVLAQFAIPAIDIKQLLLLAGRYIVSLYRDAALPNTRDAALIGLMEKLVQHPRGAVGVRVVQKLLPRLFPLNPVHEAEAAAVISCWKRTRGLG